MTYKELVAVQAKRIEELEIDKRRLISGIKDAKKYIVCIGGPLNDNLLGYSAPQLKTFWSILHALDDVSEYSAYEGEENEL